MDVAFRDRAVFLGETLVVADLHLGLSAASSVDVSLGERADVLDRLDGLVERFDPAEVVLAGDLLHSFDRIPPTVGDTVEELRTRLDRAGVRAIVTPGNHDTMLDGVWDDRTAPEYGVGNRTVVLHGHEPPDAGAALYVAGHDHPAIVIEGRRRPCYLRGPSVGGGEVLVLPAFNRLVRGTPVNGLRTEDFHSPLIAEADALRPIVRDEAADETLRFPRLGEVRRLL